MYKLLIADDELSIRRGIANSLPWADWGFEIGGLCANGIEVLEFIEKTPVDVVLSDIKMPKMDGVQLMQALNSQYPEIKIIILSGYSDFEYLNMSIKNSVMEYLLKPTDTDEFEKTFAKIYQRLEEEREQREGYRHLQQEIERGKETHGIQVVNLLLKGYVEDSLLESCQTEIEELFGLCLGNCAVLVVLPDGRFGDEEKEQYRLNAAIAETCNAVDSPMNTLFFSDHRNCVAGMVSLPPKQALRADAIVGFAAGLQEQIRQSCRVTASIGISDCCSAASQLPLCYGQAKCCARQNVFLGEGSVFSHSDFIDEFQYLDVHIPLDTVQSLLLAGNYGALQKETAAVFSQFNNRTLKEYDYVDKICIEALFGLSRWALQYNISFEKLLKGLGTDYTEIGFCDSLEKKKSFLNILLYALLKELNQAKTENRRSNSIASQIKECIDSDYASNAVSLEYVADILNKTPTYISKVFKAEYGLNFSEYLMKKRLEKGRELLRSTQSKVYRIAMQVGYADPSNFIKVFRKYYGVSPQEYRTSLGRPPYEA